MYFSADLKAASWRVLVFFWASALAAARAFLFFSAVARFLRTDSGLLFDVYVCMCVGQYSIG
jgi:hypothetical protein